jgi:hypothetical protein
VLHSRRTRLRELAEAEGRGEAFWTTDFNETVRNKIYFAARDATATSTDGDLWPQAATMARGLILRDEGWLSLVAANVPPVQDLESYLREWALHGMVPTIIESVGVAIDHLSKDYMGVLVSAFRTAVGVILSEHRVSFDFINGVMIEKDSQVLHAEVVAPTLRLLSGRPGWEEVETAYQDALREIADGNPADSITDAARALEEAFEIRGATGGSIGERLKAARKSGLLGGGDERLVSGIEEFVRWAAALRGNKSDAHTGAGDAERPDAWLAVHVVGALILRLAEAK